MNFYLLDLIQILMNCDPKKGLLRKKGFDTNKTIMLKCLKTFDSYKKVLPWFYFKKHGNSARCAIGIKRRKGVVKNDFPIAVYDLDRA